MRRIQQTLACALACLLTAAVVCGQEAGVWAEKKSGWQLLAASQRQEVFDFAEKYKAYMNVARTALTSTREVIRQARATGFADFTDASQVKPRARLIINGRDRAVILAVIGSEAITNGSRLVATHHDSPHIDLKARPVINAAGGMALFKTIYYGGIKKYQWANEPLALLGRVDTTDGRTVEVSVGLSPADPVFVIPDNAPHSDSELRSRTYTNVLTGEELDPVAGSIPGANGSVADEVVRQLTGKYGIKEEDFVSAELQLVPAAGPRDVGIDRGLVGAYGQDDRLSSFCAAAALMDVKGTPRFTALAYLSNFEEVGSVNNTGAGSEFLSSTYARLLGAQRGAAYNDLDLRMWPFVY
jgi:aspartyl aminopeptidase